MQIYHTNDIHSNFSFLGRVAAFLAENRGENDFYFDSGDFTDLKSVVVQADRGMCAMQLFSCCGPDAIAVGNNEIDLTAEDLEKLAAFPFVSANLTHNDGSPVAGLRKSILLERCGKRFLIIGISPYFSWDMVPNKYNLFFEMGDLHTVDPVPAVREELAAQAGTYDFLIVLSHCGHLVDAALREQLPEVDLWLEGHSHAVITQKQFSQSGMGEKLGRITLQVDESGIRIEDSVQIDLPEEADPGFAEQVLRAEKYADRILSAELETAGELPFDPLRESPLTNFLCDCLRAHFGGDLALMHSGIAEGALVRPVSRKSLIETFPSKLNPTIYRISGEKLLEAARLSLDPDYVRQDGKGAGFRGHILGCLGYSCNVTVDEDPFAMRIDGVPVAPEREYTLVTDDYLQRGTGYPSLRVPDSAAQFDKWFIRDLVQHYLMDADRFREAYIPRIQKEGKENGI